MIKELVTSIEKDKFEFIKKVFLNPESYDFEDNGDDWYIYYKMSIGDVL